jgi:hypothetical protein
VDENEIRHRMAAYKNFYHVIRLTESIETPGVRAHVPSQEKVHRGFGPWTSRARGSSTSAVVMASTRSSAKSWARGRLSRSTTTSHRRLWSS